MAPHQFRSTVARATESSNRRRIRCGGQAPEEDNFRPSASRDVSDRRPPVGLGLVAGMAIALAISRGFAGLLYGVTSTDPITYVSVCLLLLAIAAVAAYLPARRATRVDPLVALRYE